MTGAANRARFTIWRSSFEYFAQLVAVELAATKLNEAMADAAKLNATAAEKRSPISSPLLSAHFFCSALCSLPLLSSSLHLLSSTTAPLCSALCKHYQS